MKTKIIIIAFACIVCANAQAKCVYDTDCPDANVCSTDETGRGECVAKGAFSGTILVGSKGQQCTFPSDCQDGLLCARPQGFTRPGTCEVDAKGERRE